MRPDVANTAVSWQLNYTHHDKSGKVVEVSNDELDTIVARTKEEFPDINGPGSTEATQLSALTVAFRDLQDRKKAPEPDAKGAPKKPVLLNADELAAIELERSAFGKNGSLAAQGELVKKIGAAAAAERATAWNTKLGKIEKTGGRNPHKGTLAQQPKKEKAVGDDPAKLDHGTNPWSKVGWNITRQGQLVSQFGATKAADIAAAVGCKLGDTKPKQ